FFLPPSPVVACGASTVPPPSSTETPAPTGNPAAGSGPPGSCRLTGSPTGPVTFVPIPHAPPAATSRRRRCRRSGATGRRRLQAPGAQPPGRPGLDVIATRCPLPGGG